MNKPLWKLADFDCVEQWVMFDSCVCGYSSIFLWHQHSSGSEENSSPDDGEDEVTDEESVEEDEDSSPLATSTVFRQVPVQPQHVHVVEETCKEAKKRESERDDCLATAGAHPRGPGVGKIRVGFRGASARGFRGFRGQNGFKITA